MFFGKIKFDFASIRFRLTALYVTFFGATLIIFSSILYNALIRTHQRDFDIDLYNYAVDVADGINVDILGNLSITNDLLSNIGKIVPFTMGSSFVQVLDSRGNPVAKSRNLANGQLPLYREDWNLLAQNQVALRTIDKNQIIKSNSVPKRGNGNSPYYRLMSYNVIREIPGNFILQVAVPTTFLDQAARGLRNFLLFGIPITLVISTFAGYYFAGQALSPVNAIISKAKQLSPLNLSERIPVPTADDELKRLSITLNDLLNRLQQAFENQERFIADASHELKTPLAILRGELDLMKSRPRNPDEISEFITSASQELDHLSSLVEDLLLLARVDAGLGLISFQPTRIDETALEALSRMEILAQAKEVRLRFEMQNQAQLSHVRFSEFEILGDTDLLRIMFKNLIENAIKFSPSNSMVEIRLVDHGSSVEFSVKDQGPGISEKHQTKIFERFFRVPQNQTETAFKNNIPGAGLGLAIARRIAQAHEGTIEVRSKTEPRGETGTTFIATLFRRKKTIKSF